MQNLLETGFYISNLSVYRNLRNDPVLDGLLQLANMVRDRRYDVDLYAAAHVYSDLCRELMEYGGNLAAYLLHAAKYDINPFSLGCAADGGQSLDAVVWDAARNDLHSLAKIGMLTSGDIKAELRARTGALSEMVNLLPDFTGSDRGADIENLADFYQKNGIGIYAKYRAFSFSNQEGIQPIRSFDSIRLSDLKRYEIQRQKIIENTLGFLHNQPYNNVLLYGDRGTGKSSTVKALLNEYAEQGLRMVEVSKQDLIYIGKLLHEVGQMEKTKLKFILFIDDLTFNEDDENFGILKALLEGSLTGRPKNLAVYATTNRRHLIKETFSSREGDEVHMADTIDESLSLSDRFGLTVTFVKPDKAGFLDIVEKIAADRGLEIERELLLKGAERFALSRSGRSPRLARQYIDHVQARLALGLAID